MNPFGCQIADSSFHPVVQAFVLIRVPALKLEAGDVFWILGSLVSCGYNVEGLLITPSCVHGRLAPCRYPVGRAA